ncbi:hypothetical protein AB5N19_00018 [Seiridium cardinale]
MVFSRVPRVFILAGFVLTILVLGMNHYLYDDQTYYPSTPITHSEPKGEEADWSHATRPADPAVVGEGPFAEDGIGSSAVSPVSETQPDSLGAESLASAVVHPTTINAKPVATPAELLHPGDSQYDEPGPILLPGQCPELDFMKRVHSRQQLSDKVRYKKICIEPIFSTDVDRNEVANVSTSLFGDEVTIDIHKCNEARLPRCTSVKVHVPEPYARFNVSHLIFGVSTDYERLEDAVGAFAHWLSRPSENPAKLVALVTDYSSHKNAKIEELDQKFRDAGVDVVLVEPVHRSYSTSQSHFTVIAHMLNYSTPETQWYGLLDDDTFFPRGLKPLSDALAKLDPTKDHYVGALSEDLQAVRTFGFMAFGGAGAYLSAPLAKKLGNQLDRCIEDATGTEGDIIIRDCVYKNSKAKLTILPGLFQQDMKEDASGFFESGVQAINFHHWKSWYQAPVIQMGAASQFCGDCFLQRWRFGADTVFTNGYSIVKYLYDIDYLDLDRMEGTWSNANEDFDFSIGPLRRKLVPDEKKSYQLKDAEFSNHGEFKQLYIWKGNSEANEADGIIEMVWRK